MRKAVQHLLLLFLFLSTCFSVMATSGASSSSSLSSPLLTRKTFTAFDDKKGAFSPSLENPDGSSSTFEKIVHLHDQLFFNDPQLDVVKSRGYPYYSTCTFFFDIPNIHDLINNNIRMVRGPLIEVDGFSVQLIFYPNSDYMMARSSVSMTLELTALPEGRENVCAAFESALHILFKSMESNNQEYGEQMKEVNATVYRKHLFTKADPVARAVKLADHDAINKAITIQEKDNRFIRDDFLSAQISIRIAIVDCGPEARGWIRNPAGPINTLEMERDRYEHALQSLPDRIGLADAENYDMFILENAFPSDMPYVAIRKYGVQSQGMPIRNPRKDIGRVGIRNDDFDCGFQNAILQALFSLPIVGRRLMALESSGHVAALQNIFWKMLDPLNEDPVSVKHHLDKLGMQHHGDPTRFYLSIIERVENALKEAESGSSNRSLLPWNIKREVAFPPQQPSAHTVFDAAHLFTDLFTFKRRTCIIREAESTQNTPFETSIETGRNLVVNISQHNNLEAALRAYIKPGPVRHIQGSGKLVAASRVSKFDALPDILSITLDRFHSVSGEKRNTRLVYPPEINLGFLLTTAVDRDGAILEHLSDQSNEYVLRAVIVHKEVTKLDHNFAFVRIDNNGAFTWYRFDDELVTLVGVPEVFEEHFGGRMTERDYVFFGEEIPPKPAKEQPKSGRKAKKNKKKQQLKVSKKQSEDHKGQPKESCKEIPWAPYRDCNAHMLIYVRKSLAMGPFTPADVPDWIKQVSAPIPMTVSLTVYGSATTPLQLELRSDMSVRQMIDTMTKKLHETHPESQYEFLFIGDDDAPKMILRDHNIGSMTLKRFFGRSHDRKIVAYPVDHLMTPTERLETIPLRFQLVQNGKPVEGKPIIMILAPRGILPFENFEGFNLFAEVRCAFGLPKDIELSIVIYGEDKSGYAKMIDLRKYNTFMSDLSDGTLLYATIKIEEPALASSEPWEELSYLGKQFQSTLAAFDRECHSKALKAAFRFDYDNFKQRVMCQELVDAWKTKIPSARFVKLSLQEKEQMVMEYSSRGHLYLPTRGGNGQVTLFTWLPLSLPAQSDYFFLESNRIDVDLDELLSWYKTMKRDDGSKCKNRAAAWKLLKRRSDSLTAFFKSHPPLRMRLIKQAEEFSNSPTALKQIESSRGGCSKVLVKIAEGSTVNGVKWHSYVFARLLLQYIADYSLATNTDVLANVKRVFSKSKIVVMRAPFTTSFIKSNADLGDLLYHRACGLIGDLDMDTGYVPYWTMIFGELDDIVIGKGKKTLYNRDEPYLILLRDWTVYSLEVVSQFFEQLKCFYTSSELVLDRLEPRLQHEVQQLQCLK